MCGRFYDINDLDDITSRFRVSRAPVELLPLRYNLAPTQSAPVICFDGDERELVLMCWGLIPRWARDEKIGYRMINARAETVREKPSYRDAHASRRLIVPSVRLLRMEARRRAQAALRHPLPRRQSPAPFAGLWECWHDLGTFTIITTAANAAMQAVHDRMPLILAPEQFQSGFVGRPARCPSDDGYEG
jgi:putative SOS response-associated peptidase YedK